MSIIKPGLWNVDPAHVHPRWRGFYNDALFLMPMLLPPDAPGKLVRDFSGRGNDGTMTGSGISSAIRARGRGVYVTGVANQQYVSVTDNWTLSGQDPITVYMHAHFDSVGTGAGSDWLLSQGTQIVLRHVTGSYSFVLNSFSTNDRAEGGAVTAGEHIVLGRYDGSDLSVWVDGEQIASVVPTGSYANDTSVMCVGTADGVANAKRYNIDGVIYSAGLFARAWSDDEIRAFADDPFGPYTRWRRRSAAAVGGTVYELVAQADAVSITTADLDVVRSTNAQVSGAATVSAELDVRRAITVQAVGVATASSELDVVRSLSVQADGVSTTSATPVAIAGQRVLTTQADGLAVVTADIAPLRIRSVQAGGIAAVASDVDVVRAISVQADGIATVSAALAVGGAQTLNAQVTSSSTVSAELDVVRSLSVQAVGVANTSISQSVVRALSVQIDGVATTSAAIVAGAANDLSVQADGLTTVTVAIAPLRIRSASVAGAATLATDLDIVRAATTAAVGASAVSVALDVVRAMSVAVTASAAVTITLNKIGAAVSGKYVVEHARAHAKVLGVESGAFDAEHARAHRKVGGAGT